MTSRIRTLLASIALTLLAGCTPGADSAQTSAYAVNITHGAAVEIDHTGYDAALGGYWLVGGEATIQFSHIEDSPVPESFSFMLRTKADASAARPSELDVFKIITPRYLIVTRFNPGTPAPVDILTHNSEVLVKSDTTGRYVKFERIGERIKVTLSRECLTQLIGADAAITWSDKRTDAKRKASEAEAWRRVL